MGRQQVKKGKIGRRRVQFRLFHPEAQTVSVAGDFNQWDIAANPMRRSKNGTWTKVMMMQPGRYEYRFYADGRWYNDPANALKCANGFGSQNDVLIALP
ncbi:MAG TPA: isoamylase early set domain-containing protein [Candidatus Baltobacteraceae bacterium]|nr:isoamylase early set domain-containing protein [Candidatus Baltobacteraceae bacterium]